MNTKQPGGNDHYETARSIFAAAEEDLRGSEGGANFMELLVNYQRAQIHATLAVVDALREQR